MEIWSQFLLVSLETSTPAIHTGKNYTEVWN